MEPLPPRLDPALLVRALDRLAIVVPPVIVASEPIQRTITLGERAAIIRAALAAAGPVVLQDLLAGVRDRVVIAVTFLAMLELVKRREVLVEQDEPWGPIIVRSAPRFAASVVRRATGSRRRGGRVRDEVVVPADLGNLPVIGDEASGGGDGDRAAMAGDEGVRRRAPIRDEAAPPATRPS